MRRLAKLLLVLAVVAAAVLFKTGRSVSVELELQFADPPPPHASLIFTNKNEHVEGELQLANPPPRAHRTVRLRRGDYDVGVRLTPERTLTRPLHVDEAGTSTLDLR